MLGTVATTNDLGAIPCAISWLYKGINEKRQKSGARFSVRVSALGINATKPGSSAKDLLAALATGNYLNVERIYLFLITRNDFNVPPFASQTTTTSFFARVANRTEATKTALNE